MLLKRYATPTMDDINVFLYEENVHSRALTTSALKIGILFPCNTMHGNDLKQKGFNLLFYSFYTKLSSY